MALGIGVNNSFRACCFMLQSMQYVNSTIVLMSLFGEHFFKYQNFVIIVESNCTLLYITSPGAVMLHFPSRSEAESWCQDQTWGVPNEHSTASEHHVAENCELSSYYKDFLSNRMIHPGQKTKAIRSTLP